jgi:GAF domain-containing protein
MSHADPSSLLVARALEQVVGLSLRHTSSRSLLTTVVQVTRQVLPGDVEASVTLVSRHRPRTAASTGPLASALDQAQYAAGDGPCLHSATTREAVLVPDTRSDDRWAPFRTQAVEHGTLSSLSVPLDVAPDVAGSLNVYSAQVGTFSADVRSAVTVLTAHTASALGNVRDYQAVRSEARRLRTAW